MHPLKKIVVYNRFFGPLRTIRMFAYKVLYLFLLHIVKLKKVTIRLFDFHLIVPLDSKGIGRVLFVFRQREMDQKQVLQKILKPDSIILDIGTNIGYYLLLENSLMSNSGKFYTIEPDPRNIEVLKANIALNNLKERVVIENFAFSDYNGKGDFYLTERTNLNSLINYPEKTISTIQVRVRDFGTYLEEIAAVDLVRMDVEGAEIQIFNSLLRSLQNKKITPPKYIVFEPHTEVYSTHAEFFAKILRDLFENDYKAYMMSSYEESESTLKKLGYYPDETIKDCPFTRGLYFNINSEDAVNLLCYTGGVRTCCLKYEEPI